MPTLSDTNLVAFNPESGSQIQDVVGLTASLDCVSSDKLNYRQSFSPSIKTTPTNLDGSPFCGQLGVAIFDLSLLNSISVMTVCSVIFDWLGLA